ncbi:coatomer subunit beta'-like isoform X2 [Ptychodera flava]|uniref:coatomer subunit beta'-like isoform X2 n=1 Tax=Ptychodera flava TaxID=63121 RepID=UPI00396A783D
MRTFLTRSNRVKCIDLHPKEPWILAGLFSGVVQIWNYETKTLINNFEVIDLPVRAAKFIARKNWFVCGSDDMGLRVYNYNTKELIKSFEAHSDFIRSIVVHPTQPFIISSSDDMLIKLWNWEKMWRCEQVCEGHFHYIMQIVINPKDNNTFASGSLDTSIKVWQLGSPTANFSLNGHESGVNAVDYYKGGEKPYLISGGDDNLVKIWDYQNKTCVQTLRGHTHNVTAVCFHPDIPIILSGGEDDNVRVWHANTYRHEKTLNYGLARAWYIAVLQGTNMVAMGFDEGSVMLKLGSEELPMSMDSSGKIIWAKHSEIQQANLKSIQGLETKDGERLPLAVKDMGSCEIYPQTIAHNPNGRFVVVCGDGEYIIYTAMALRNKAFGSAQEFVWAQDSNDYATRTKYEVKIYRNFKEVKSFKPTFRADSIYGGPLLGVSTSEGLAFYEWTNTDDLIRRIEITPKAIFWSDSGELVCITTEDSFFILKYSTEAVSKAQETKEGVTEDGIEDAFDVVGEIQECVKTGLWVGDCFIYTNSVNRLNYYVGGEIVTISHLDRVMSLLGYIPRDNRLYLGDKELNVVSYELLLSVLEYQTAVMRRDFETADKVLPTIPREQRTRVAHFLEKQGFKPQAMAVTIDADHKFDLAIQLGNIKTAHQVAMETESEEKWKQLAELATSKCEFKLASECLHNAQDYGALLLLATCSGDAKMVEKVAKTADTGKQSNVAFVSNFLLGRVEECIELLIKTNRIPEAAFFARSFMPSKMAQIVELWKECLGRTDKKKANALADPVQYENLFVGLKEAYYGEKYLYETQKTYPASTYLQQPRICERNVLQELEAAIQDGTATIDTECGDVVFRNEVKDMESDLASGKEVKKTENDFELRSEVLNRENEKVVRNEVQEDSQQSHLEKVREREEEDTIATTKTYDFEDSLDLELENLNVDDISDVDINLDDELLAD